MNDTGPEPAGDSRLLLALPELPPSDDPDALVLADPAPPVQGRPCGNRRCRRPVGTPYQGMPARHQGYCPECGTRYSLLPQLRRGESLDGGRYEVRGCLAHGGLGWVYLAVDTRLRNHPVVLKGLLNSNDPEAQERMLRERDQLIAISHESVVRILDYVSHQPGDADRRPADYIVMEYVGGKPLRRIVEEAERGRCPFGPGRPLTLEHVARYGCQILDALTALHERGLVYCDMKPDNVIHRGTRVVLIDLGGVQRLDDPDLAPVITAGYAAPETGPGRGPTVAHDIHTVGRTLEELARWAVDGAADSGLGHESFRRLVKRATHHDPRLRFASAAEMSGQLEGVLRELLSLRTGRHYTRPSEVFEPTPTLLDTGLATVPGLEHWRDRRAKDYRGRITSPPLDTGRPAPSQVAVGLPAPRPRRGDPAFLQLRMPEPQDPRAVVRQLERLLGGGVTEPSAGVHLRLCRAYLELREAEADRRRDRGAGRDTGSAAENGAGSAAERDTAQAQRQLREAEAVLGVLPDERPALDWHIAWHRGLLHLALGDVAGAQEHFEEVYGALPGEYAPKLALGYCAEHRGDLARARRFHHAVWQRNPQQGSAAFGLARVHLADGERESAADVLGRVPPMSRHYDAARVAAVRIRAARLFPGPEGLPDRRGLAAVREELPGLDLDGGAESGPERTRLTAEIREWALDWLQRVADRTGNADEDRAHLGELAGDLFGGGPEEPPDERGLRTLLAYSFQQVARLPGTTKEQNQHLVDCSNAVFPRTWFFRPHKELTR